MIRRLALLGIAGMFGVAACSDSGPDLIPRVEFALSTRGAVTAAPGLHAAASLSETYTDASGDTLILDSVFVVVRKLELKRSVAVACDSSSSDSDGCEELKLGPFLVELPLGTAGAERQFTVAIDTGSYNKVEFEVHKAESGDTAFVAAHPGYNGVSIRVVGSFNGTPFVYTTGLDVEQEIEFAPALVVGEGPTTFTLFVDLSTWFKNGTDVIDPVTAMGGGGNVSLVHENIQNSFQAFEDENHDGHDDHGL